jgi:hypothetical protein
MDACQPAGSDLEDHFAVYCVDPACYWAVFNVTSHCPSPCVDSGDRTGGITNRSTQEGYQDAAKAHSKA